jgi:hypothetical protein
MGDRIDNAPPGLGRQLRDSKRVINAALAAAAVIAAGLAITALGFIGSLDDDRAARFEPRIQELPGGFNPAPSFGLTASELEYRGAECLLEVENSRYRLVRRCAT